MGHEPIGTIFLATSALLTIVIVITSALSSVSGNHRVFLTSLVTTVLTILTMIVTRHMLRTYYLHPHFSPETLPVSIQWDILVAFLICAVGLIAYLFWLAKTVWHAFHPKHRSPPLEAAS
jgi:hypothetical protein